MSHFKSEIIPAGRWSRLPGTSPGGDSDEPRPHLIPTTEEGRHLVALDAAGLIGHTGLCPGEVILENGQTTLAYRFITLTDRDANHLISELGVEIDRIVTQGEETP